MSMTEPTPAAPAKPKRAQKRRAAAPPAKADEFAGMTATDCCAACNENRCVITGINACGHPYKASHPTLGPQVQAKITRAKKRLRHQKIHLMGE